MNLKVFSPQKRNIGLDLLRVIAMLMIVIWHSTNHGGLDSLSGNLDLFNMSIHYIQALTCVSVNVYVLISGYFLCTQKFRVSRILKIFIETWFYAWLILIFCKFTNIIQLSAKDIIFSIFPISYRLNWFVTSYIGLCILSPFLNKMLNLFSHKQHLMLVIVLYLSTSLMRDILPMSFSLDVYDGKRLSWFIVLYIIAAYIRKYIKINNIKPFIFFLVYLISTLFLFFVWVFVFYFGNRLNIPQEIINYGCKYYYMYSSSFVLASSLSLFLTFVNLKITRDNYLAKYVLKLAPLTFGVYLIHDNYIIRDVVWEGVLTVENPNIHIIAYVFAYSIMIFFLCILIDSIRNLIFSIFYNSDVWKKKSGRIDYISEYIYNHLDKYLE